MKKLLLTISLLLLGLNISAQSYKTQILSDDIYTLEVKVNGEPGLSVASFANGDRISISFDRIGPLAFERLRYRIKLCNANWTPNKQMMEMDYLDGFSDNEIDDYQSSKNTSVEYAHFNLSLPNQNTNLLLSGNYVVEIFEEDVPDKTLSTACFSILDKKLNIGYKVSSKTNIDTNKGHQQVDIELLYPNFNIKDPLNDIKVSVVQNNKLATKRWLNKPDLIGNNKLTYQYNNALIFEAGNEYRRFELVSHRYNGMNISHIEYNRPLYYMSVKTDKMKANKTYIYDQDQNGRFYIRNKEAQAHDTEADYFMTHFALSANQPLTYPIYLSGDFTNNELTSTYQMNYDALTKEYYLTLLLKQGLYNYQYLTGSEPSTAHIEGNYSETENEYAAYVYYRPMGQRYDSLIGFSKFSSQTK